MIDAAPLCRKIDGVGRYTRELVNQLAKTYPEHKIILIGFIGDHLEASDLLKHPNISFKKVPLVRKIYSGLYSRIVRIPIDWLLPKFDVFIGTNFIKFPYVKKTPSIIVIHDLAYARFPETIEKKNLEHLRKHIPLTMRESAGIIATSDFVKKEIEDIFPNRSNVFTSTIGIDNTKWRPSNDVRQNYILAVSTVEPRKNFSSLIEAYRMLPPTLQASHPLVIVGKKGWGDSNDSLKSDEHISFTGYVEDEELLQLFQRSKLFVSPSLYEGFGLPVLEALSTNTPVLCSDIHPYKDVAGEYAHYFDPNSVDDIREALMDALEDGLPNPKGFNPEKYSWQNSIKAFDMAIEKVLSE